MDLNAQSTTKVIISGRLKHKHTKKDRLKDDQNTLPDSVMSADSVNSKISARLTVTGNLKKLYVTQLVTTKPAHSAGVFDQRTGFTTSTIAAVQVQVSSCKVKQGLLNSPSFLPPPASHQYSNALTASADRE